MRFAGNKIFVVLASVLVGANATVLSLYGPARKLTPAMLRGIDTLVFDLQDIGCRSYTYISTMTKCIEAAAENHI